jgi:hypothetical protein
MIEDSFEKWFWDVWEENLYAVTKYDLEAAYKAGWKRSLEVNKALTELTQIAEEFGEYD